MAINDTVERAITIYCGSFIFIFGILGNILNIRLLWSTRRNPCAFLFMISSLFNCILLFSGPFTTVLNSVVRIDLYMKNPIWCKTHAVITSSSVLISLTCMCLASTDRYLISCRQQKYRKLSRLSYAVRAVIIVNVNPTTGLPSCAFKEFDSFAFYIIFIVYPVYYGILPSTILIITGMCTYRNISQLRIGHRRETFQRQLTLMMLVQIPIIIFSTWPYVVMSEYAMISAQTTKANDQITVESLIAIIVKLANFIAFASPFYTFLASSKVFREAAKDLIRCRRTARLENARIQPVRNLQVAFIKTDHHA